MQNFTKFVKRSAEVEKINTENLVQYLAKLQIFQRLVEKDKILFDTLPEAPRKIQLVITSISNIQDFSFEELSVPFDCLPKVLNTDFTQVGGAEGKENKQKEKKEIKYKQTSFDFDPEHSSLNFEI